MSRISCEFMNRSFHKLTHLKVVEIGKPQLQDMPQLISYCILFTSCTCFEEAFKRWMEGAAMARGGLARNASVEDTGTTNP